MLKKLAEIAERLFKELKSPISEFDHTKNILNEKGKELIFDGKTNLTKPEPKH